MAHALQRNGQGMKLYDNRISLVDSGLPVAIYSGAA